MRRAAEPATGPRSDGRSSCELLGSPRLPSGLAPASNPVQSPGPSPQAFTPSVIDSHCHLADEAFAADLDAVVSRARAAGLERALVILAAGDAAEAAQAERLAALWPEARVAIGVHPHAAHQFADDPSRAAAIVREQVARTPSARAVGEIGLDYHYDFSPRDGPAGGIPRAGARRQSDEPAGRHSHARGRRGHTRHPARGRRRRSSRRAALLHGRRATRPRRARSRVLHLARRASSRFRAPTGFARRSGPCPLDRLLAETDSPFLAPVPARGKRNEPAHVVHVIAALARLNGIDGHAMAARTTANFHALFQP